MEEKRKEVREYLESKVNPIIRPLVEEIVRKRPGNIVAFMNEYTHRMMSKPVFYLDMKTTEMPESESDGEN